MLVLAYRKCSTCIKALNWLEENNIEFEERPIKEENPTYEELKVWYEMSRMPLKKLTRVDFYYMLTGFKEKEWAEKMLK